MGFLLKLKGSAPSVKSTILAGLSAILLVTSFPGFEFSPIAFVALIPLFIAINWEKESVIKSSLLGWVFGTFFFFCTCWWLTFAPITYAGFPTILAYVLLFFATAGAGFYFAIFGGVFSLFLKRFDYWGILAAPFLLTAVEFLRLWTSGNNWNSIGYSQAFGDSVNYASFGGVFFVGFYVVFFSTYLVWAHYIFKSECGIPLYSTYLPKLLIKSQYSTLLEKVVTGRQQLAVVSVFFLPIVFSVFLGVISIANVSPAVENKAAAHVIAIQPNVPMKGLSQTRWTILRQRQAEIAERAIENPDFSGSALRRAKKDALPEEVEERKRFYEELSTETLKKGKKIVVFPESPMNFQYELDPEFRDFIKGFSVRNDVSVLFNSAEPDRTKKDGFFNSAVMVNEQGKKIVQYNKIFLLPFGEFVPLPDFLAQFVPTMVGRFSAGREYDLLPFGEAKAGVMICFESHFPSLSREYVRRGADVLVEMTNDGYLGNTPVLRQHLASAVFRAVETNRPVLRVTNVGVTAYVSPDGKVLDQADVYTESARVWSVSKSGSEQTIYVRYGDWFAWLCSIVTLGLLFLCFRKGKESSVDGNLEVK